MALMFTGLVDGTVVVVVAVVVFGGRGLEEREKAKLLFDVSAHGRPDLQSRLEAAES